MTAQIVRAVDNGWLVRMHVRPEAKVGPGDALFDVLHEDGCGIALTVRSPDFGIVKSYEGVDIFYHSSGEARRVKKGDPMFLIAEHLKGRAVAGDKGLIPRPTRVIAKRRERQNAFH